MRAAAETTRSLCVAVNATAYDASPSGARNRTVGLCAALLRAGVRLDVFASAVQPMAPLVADELGEPPPAQLWSEWRSDLDPRHPLRRAVLGPRWLAAQLDPRRHDLFLTDYYPVAARVPTALSIHDLRDLDPPPPGASGRRLIRAGLRRTYFSLAYPRMARRAALVLTLTDALASEVSDRLAIPRDRIVVVRPGVARRFGTATPASGPGEHLLAVGMADERKGLPDVCRALRLASERGDVLPVVVTGRRTAFVDGMLASHADLVDRSLLRFEGMVGDERLVELYQGAAALLHPSRYEGFGIPVLEAMSLGVPVIVAADPAVVEVAGPGATYVDVGDAVGWASAMARASDAATAAVRPDRAAIARAAQNGWDAGAARLVDAARRLPGRPRAASDTRA